MNKKRSTEEQIIGALMTLNKLLLRKIHRWLGLIAGVQLLLWTVSGFYFAYTPIEDIRGGQLLPIKTKPVPISGLNLISITDLVAINELLAELSLADFQLVINDGKPIYIAGGQRFDAQSGARVDALDEHLALKIVAQRTGVKALKATLVTQVEPGSEYRGGDLPAWKIDVDQENAAIYISATTGQIRAVRTTRWRIYDFLWSLHIMDYEDRESFNHWLLTVMASLGVITVASGLVLFFVTQRFRPRRTRL